MATPCGPPSPLFKTHAVLQPSIGACDWGCMSGGEMRGVEQGGCSCSCALAILLFLVVPPGARRDERESNTMPPRRKRRSTAGLPPPTPTSAPFPPCAAPHTTRLLAGLRRRSLPTQCTRRATSHVHVPRSCPCSKCRPSSSSLSLRRLPPQGVMYPWQSGASSDSSCVCGMWRRQPLPFSIGTGGGGVGGTTTTPC